MAAPRIERARWLTLVALATGAVGAIATLRHLSPYATHSVLPPCPLHALTGIYCPGCGATRALYSLLQGDLPRAMTMNPLLLIALPFVALMVLHIAGWRPRALDPVMRVLANPKLWLVVLVGFTVLRNLPFAPFNALAPH
ncbi:MAG: DUF2752 domain-containing protein [Lysobacteraceae bacterium]